MYIYVLMYMYMAIYTYVQPLALSLLCRLPLPPTTQSHCFHQLTLFFPPYLYPSIYNLND